MTTPKGYLGRCHKHDYRSRCIYLITITTNGRLPVLGVLQTAAGKASVKLTKIGRIAEQVWLEVPQHFPGVRLFEYQVMPDHFHGLLFVERELDKPLGSIIGFFKAHSTSLCKKAGLLPGSGAGSLLPGSGAGSLLPGSGAGSLLPGSGAGSLLPGSGAGSLLPALWAKGYTDSILLHKGQFAAMRAYIKDNPRRLAVKRAHRDLFKIVRDIDLIGERFAGIGNHFLLEHPKKCVIQCSRSITPEALAEKEAELLFEAEHGAVLISPCISPGEKQIARTILAKKLPLIVLLENGFPKYYKPPKTYFDACAEGRLLMLAPWPYHAGKRVITRRQCLELNRFAERLTGGKPPDTEPSGKPAP